MILPTKHIRVADSLLGIGGYVLSILDEPKTLDEIWLAYSAATANRTFPSKQPFEVVILAIDLLYAVSAITNNDGKIRKCNS